jgi:hypothetical protein
MGPVIYCDGALMTSIVGQYEQDFEAPPRIPSSAETTPDLQDRPGDIPSAKGNHYQCWDNNAAGNLKTSDKRTEEHFVGITSSTEKLDKSRSQEGLILRPELLIVTGFKIHKSKEFKPGQVFKMLWSEPAGAEGSSTRVCVEKIHGEKTYSSIRRFVIIDTREGCICL